MDIQCVGWGGVGGSSGEAGRVPAEEGAGAKALRWAPAQYISGKQVCC